MPEVKQLPLVLINGILCNHSSFESILPILQENFPNRLIICADFDTRFNSFFGNLRNHCNCFINWVKENHHILKDGFDIIAHSQGNIIARYFIENVGYPKVERLCLLVGPNLGVNGIPLIPKFLNKRLKKLVENLPYGWKDRFTFPNYWKTNNYDRFMQSASVLAEISNLTTDEKYSFRKNNILSLKQILCVASSCDDRVRPYQSSLFMEVLETPENDIEEYVIDIDDEKHMLGGKDIDHIGLNEMLEKKQLFRYIVDIKHHHFIKPTRRTKPAVDKFFEDIVIPFLKDKLEFSEDIQTLEF
eukprot:TRINITY_DN9757_c0_g1_i1.p1 TRINITY_DN9757_c0_g1~~TRINITY_DN9757_c0_g1_i1.p1  ORF type:complete len:311 (+),score=74.76 TRINITY_DN9757_c0_g1_i1:28-933(+)